MAVTTSSILKLIPARFTLDSLDKLFAAYPKRDFQVRLWDGSTWGATAHPRFTLVLKDPDVLRQMFLSHSELTLGESYVFDSVDIEGDLEAAFEVGDYLLTAISHNLPTSLRLAGILQKLPAQEPTLEVDRTAQLQGSVHSRGRDRQAISYHYDLPPEFFALWLDHRMLYSCAYFVDGNKTDLDTAQLLKLDYICKKLRLRQGDRLLDIGCGWGGLLVHAAAHYGVQALGITLSIQQAKVARERIREAALNDRCRVEVCDYRDLELDRQFDKIVSVGMFEHVGETQLPAYFSRAWQLLRPGGAFLNSGITASATYQRQGPSFIDHYVFPDGELVPLNSSLGVAEKCGFEIRDVESLREHYALTLQHWVRRLEHHAERAQCVTNPLTYRIWRLYMAASAHAFRTARINLYHTLFAKPHNGDSGMPLTRIDWYNAWGHPMRGKSNHEE
ncbi:MAG: class I SAM-dependent methyltransferase [Candidatus Sulfotelmatobacter sp.]